ncbi:acyltransferase family protein [Amycolatopsis aidingensis]|uniref:acyltransferase family protein n=1 Tax=Amycolatopsis aidingensis TaxID=2842453 RepID=UPI001C0C293A|nr:acyltransferase [Amycolatopsis aidingensis]
MNWDVIRVVAILFVVSGHVTNLAPSLPGIEGYPFTLSIPFGTVTLLVLSGYFIAPTIRKRETGRWLRARLARLLPAYLVALLVVYLITRWAVVGFNGWQHGPGVLGILVADPVAPAGAAEHTRWPVPDLGDLLANILLVHEWDPEFFTRIDNSYWTLPIQVAAFTGAALVWRSRFRHTSPARVLWSVLAAAAACPLLSLLITSLPTASGLYYAHLFAAGVAIWLWGQHRLGTGQLLPMLAVTVVLHAFRTGPPQLASVLGFTIMLGLICAAARGPDWNLPLLRALRRPITWLAGISYCLYLVHQQLGYIVARALSDAGLTSGWLRLGLVLATVILAAWLLTVLVERPAYRWLTRAPAPTAVVARPATPAEARA